MERNPEVPASTQDEALFITAATREESRGAPHTSKDLTSLKRHEQVPHVHTQLEWNPKLPAITPQKPQNSPLHTR